MRVLLSVIVNCIDHTVNTRGDGKERYPQNYFQIGVQYFIVKE